MNAIEQAIEALESAIRVYEASSPSVMTVERRQCVDAITALQSMQGEAVAYAVFADNGNIRIWCADPIQTETLKQEYGQSLTPLYTHPKSPAVVDGYVLLEDSANPHAGLIHVGYTNPYQIEYAKEDQGEGAFYSDTENDCWIPLFMLRTHLRRLTASGKGE
jgi:hypothetical protein